MKIDPIFPRLHLGCGGNIFPDWLNTDLESVAEGVEILDFTKPFPFLDNSFEAVFCEHTIEHVAKDDAIFMCKEVYNVLKSGGWYRVVTPCLENMTRMIFLSESPVTNHYLEWFRGWAKMPDATISDAFNAMFYNHGHQHIYMKTEMSDLLKNIGFIDHRFYEVNQFGQHVFNGTDSHGKWIGEEINKIESFAIEVRKP